MLDSSLTSASARLGTPECETLIFLNSFQERCVSAYVLLYRCVGGSGIWKALACMSTGTLG